ncbi:MAG: tetratricopeptide repeat protein [Planctomycetota bacterium]
MLDSEALYEDGLDAIREGRLDDARAIGEQLIEMRYSGGFEVLGLVERDEGDLDAAIAILEQGVEKASTAWLLWQLLGNSYSDAGRPEEAAGAYEHALGCDGVDVSSVRLNQATLAFRSGLRDEGFRFLDEVVDPALHLYRESLRLGEWEREERYAEILPRAAALLTEADDDADPDVLAQLVVRAAWAKHKLGGARDDVVRELLVAYAYDPICDDAQWAIREVEDRRADDTRQFEVLLEATHPAEPALRYFVSFTTVATTKEEAAELARRHEEAAGGIGLRTEEVEQGDPIEDYPIGVYRRSGRQFFDPESEVEDADVER